MRIYLAASYSARLAVEARAAELRARGHNVTSTWHNGHHETRPGIDANGTEAEQAQWAREDLRDIRRADALILCADLGASRRGGAHVETGYALGYGKALVVVGDTSNVFYTLDEVLRFATWGECVVAMDATL
uniref:Putative nucleoside deoxyribosyltransferase n=1 Tax=viral metagenome TaxID=1070528 RepID=A0A6M3LL75_9ZZZZ